MVQAAIISAARRGEIWRDTLTGENHELVQAHEVAKFNEIMRKRRNRYRYVGRIGE